MSRALFTAVSGLRNHQVWLDVIGNNIANANTVGYKASTVVFDDILGQTISSGVAPTANKGGVNPVQVGLGMTIGSISQNFLQGSIQTTNRNTDMAIQGDGFFVLANGSDRTYSRAGSFTLDANGDLVDTATGFKVQGANGDITVSLGAQSAAIATTAATFKGNLDFSSAEGSTFVSTFNVLDSVGASHTMTITFTKNFTAAAGRWDWAVTAAAGDTAIGSLTTSTGNIVFNGTGAVSAGASQAIGIVYAAGAGVTTPQAITLDFGTATNTNPLTGVAAPSTVTLANQDGVASGTLQNFAVGLDGTITAFFTNGRTATIDTVQLAVFANSAGLVKIGTNQYREAAASGAAVIGNPSTGGRGTVVSGALEMSNVDLAAEFSSMIIAERGFQANARTIATANSMLEELVNLKR
jgi:flagellar hook protein FlgE